MKSANQRHDTTRSSALDLYYEERDMTFIRRCFKGRTCYLSLFIFLGLCVLAYFMLDSQYYYMSKPLGGAQVEFQDGEPSSFKPYTFGQVYTIADVCIEDDTKTPRIPTGVNKSISAKKLVVYNAKYPNVGELKVAGSASVSDNRWDIQYMTESIPPEYHYIVSYPAYFVTTSCTGNLYHLWEDTLVGLYGVLKATHRLEPLESNQLFFRNPVFPDQYNLCHSKDRFKDVILAMGFREPINSFHYFPAKTCFRDAVFGWLPASSEEASDYVINHIPFDVTTCKPRTVTIIQRVHRQILNVDELLKASLDMGLVNTQNVVLENKTFAEQYSLIRCTDILIGLHGAGLEWLIFMRPNRGLLEMSWNHQFGFYYSTSSYASYRGLKTSSLLASKILLNWDSFSKMCRKGKPVTKPQQQMILNRDRIIRSDNPWKWADAFFDVGQFKSKLKSLAEEVFTS